MKPKQVPTSRNIKTLQEAIKGARCFVSLSKADVLKPEDILAMAKDRLCFALVNQIRKSLMMLPKKTREDLIMATGRSDHLIKWTTCWVPIHFPRGLDVRATEINEAMKLAAVRALANLAKSQFPIWCSRLMAPIRFSLDASISFPNHLIRAWLPHCARRCQSSHGSGQATAPITDWSKYNQDLLETYRHHQKLTSRLSIELPKPQTNCFAMPIITKY